MRCAGLTAAEHFRDAEGQDVLLFIDNIFHFTQVISAGHFFGLGITNTNLVHKRH